MRLPTLFVLATIAFAQAMACQNVWKVCCQGGPGVHFLDLPQAVAAASPGDEIWVYYDVLGCPGNGYTSPVIDKPIRISGFFVSATAVGATQINVKGPVVILNIAAGQRVELSGLSIAGDYTTWTTNAAIVALDCQGDILLDNIYLNNNGTPTTFARLERCSNVVLRGCDLRLGGSPLDIIDSNALLSTTSIYHSQPSGFYPYASTTEGVRVTNSTVTAIGSVIWGADRQFFGGPYVERPAVVVDSGVFRVGPSTVLRGGSGISSQFPAYGYQVLHPATGSVQLDPRGFIQRPPTLPPAPVPADMPATFHSWLVANETFGVTVAGPAGGFAVLAFGDWLPNVPTPLGLFSLDPTSAFPIDLVPLSSTQGYYSWTLNCPLTAPIAHAYAFQAVTIAQNGAIGLTIASPLTVSWPGGVIP